MKYLVLLSLLVLVGCGPLSPSSRLETEYNIRNPELVAEHTPKGKLYRAYIHNSSGHYVYWFEGNTNTTTLNIRRDDSTSAVVIEN